MTEPHTVQTEQVYETTLIVTTRDAGTLATVGEKVGGFMAALMASDGDVHVTHLVDRVTPCCGEAGNEARS